MTIVTSSQLARPVLAPPVRCVCIHSRVGLGAESAVCLSGLHWARPGVKVRCGHLSVLHCQGRVSQPAGVETRATRGKKEGCRRTRWPGTRCR